MGKRASSITTIKKQKKKATPPKTKAVALKKKADTKKKVAVKTIEKQVQQTEVHHANIHSWTDEFHKTWDRFTKHVANMEQKMEAINTRVSGLSTICEALQEWTKDIEKICIHIPKEVEKVKEDVKNGIDFQRAQVAVEHQRVQNFIRSNNEEQTRLRNDLAYLTSVVNTMSRGAASAMIKQLNPCSKPLVIASPPSSGSVVIETVD